MSGQRLNAALALTLLSSQVLARTDVPEQFYKVMQGATVLPTIPFLPDPLPAHLVNRVKDVPFSELSLALKHALLWDSGLVISGDTTRSVYVQIKVPCGSTMKDIFLPRATISDPDKGDCGLVPCNAQGMHYAFFNCSLANVEPQTTCGVLQDAPVEALSTNPVWSEDGVIDPEPKFRVYKKRQVGTVASNTSSPSSSLSSSSSSSTLDSAVSTLSSVETTLYTIQEKSLDIQTDTSLKSCPNKATFIIPCRELTSSDVGTGSASWCNPTPSSFVDVWISQEVLVMKTKTQSNKDSSTIHTFVSLFIIAAVGCVILGLCLWRRLKRGSKSARSSAGVPSGLGDSSEELDHVLMTTHNHHMITSDSENNTTGTEYPHDRATAFTSLELEKINANFCDRSRDLADFCDDQELMMKRISYSSLHFSTLIARGANGEVWRGEYASQDVAIKRMLRDKRGEIMFMEVFAREIRLASMLEHPNIVRFIGLSWRSLSELCMVSEFMPTGDLAHYLLSKESRNLSWPNHKLALALDIANALVYLHSLMPVIIHRDLKSLNVLLNENLEAKLSDFGLSRERSFEETMTSGVGTMLWTAPEVLRGDRYTEKADIYSYGVVLSELDTCLPPYSLNEQVARAKQKTAQLLPMIRNGQIKPQFRPSVPKPLLELAQSCLDYVPEKRPNAMQIVYILRSKVMPTLQ